MPGTELNNGPTAGDTILVLRKQFFPPGFFAIPYKGKSPRLVDLRQRYDSLEESKYDIGVNAALRPEIGIYGISGCVPYIIAVHNDGSIRFHKTVPA